ncbi:MAG: bifunctional pyr operon transcriptional regulator/uracil phosphoribosyltransferase PyrR [Tepidisphaerales bacterium]
MRTTYDARDVARVVEELTGRIAAAFPPDKPLNIIGIRTRGENLAQRLVDGLRARGYAQLGFGTLDVTLYRDDLSAIGTSHVVRPTDILIDLAGKPLLLVDDVLHTGRSVRAALNALNDFGRPSVVRLAVLADRGGRELPIAADFVGIRLKEVPEDHRVNVRFADTDGRDEIVVEPRS